MTSKPGQKFDGAKLPVGRGFIGYFGRAIKAVAMVSKYGAQKYAVSYEDKNWERLDDARLRYGDGRARHIVDEAVDGPWDPESKLLHAAHAAWNAMAYLELCLREGMSLVQPETDVAKVGALIDKLCDEVFGAAPATPEVGPELIEAMREVPGRVVYTPGPIESFREVHGRDKGMLPPISTVMRAGGIQVIEHWCAKTQRMAAGYNGECEACKTAIYGAREL